MIFTALELQAMFPNEDSATLIRIQKGIEQAIRAYTNNPFQLREARIVAAVESGNIIGFCSYFGVGDTLMISNGVNKGLYTISAIADGTISTNETLYDTAENLITKVVYPEDVKLGVANLLNWELEDRDKANITSESISRHSVSYADLTSADATISGYPSYLFGFLTPHIKARF